MPCSGERVTVSLDTTQGGGDEHDRGRRQRREWEGGTAGAGTVAHRSAAAGFQRPGREVVQSRVGMGLEAPLVKHTHPGEEIIYFLEGSLEYQIEGQPPMTFNAGDALTVLAGAACAVRNVGSGNAAELATYVVERGSRSSR
jgi:quercetin dioxygenase-like cupin family protein